VVASFPLFAWRCWGISQRYAAILAMIQTR
jgi:hypothetical protein